MGRPPCCDKIGVKKGPWTPEEDIILVSYIQEHGPGNWRAVPTNTGLHRCSKSCRLRWTNYLRPGIKRGNFTEQEEKMIIHLQDLLGNRWAAIASYLPQRTDNDIKNFWNTHLQKKLKKIHGHGDIDESPSSKKTRKGKWERRLQTDIHMAKQALCDALSLKNPIENVDQDSKPLIINQHVLPRPPVYASSAENIARLLENWNNNPPKKLSGSGSGSGSGSRSGSRSGLVSGSGSDNTAQSSCNNNPSVITRSSPSDGAISVMKPKFLDTLMNFNSTYSDVTQMDDHKTRLFHYHQDTQMVVPLTFLEKCLLEDGASVNQGNGDLMDIPLGGTADLF